MLRTCDREIELLNFIEQEQTDLGSDFAYSNFFNQLRNTAERVELRDYIVGDTLPAFHSGPCDLPKIVRTPERTVSIDSYDFNMIREQGDVTGCKVDDERVDERGDFFAPGARFDRSFNRESANLLARVRKVKFAQAWELLSFGAYGLYANPTTQIGALDFGREAPLKNIDLVGTDDDWCMTCSDPSETIENIASNMAKTGAGGGILDVMHSPSSWKAMQMHEELDAFRFDTDRNFSGFQSMIDTTYRGVIFKGSTNQGRVRHWLAMGEYYGSDHVLRPMVEDGNILVVSNDSFQGLDLHNPWSVDYREILPTGLNFFLNEDYDRKCRKTEIWIEHRHLMLARNVNGAALAKVVDVNCEFCKELG